MRRAVTCYQYHQRANQRVFKLVEDCFRLLGLDRHRLVARFTGGADPEHGLASGVRGMSPYFWAWQNIALIVRQSLSRSPADCWFIHS